MLLLDALHSSERAFELPLIFKESGGSENVRVFTFCWIKPDETPQPIEEYVNSISQYSNAMEVAYCIDA